VKVFVGLVIEDDCLEEVSLMARRLQGLIICDTVPEPQKDSEWKRIGTLISNAFLHHFKQPSKASTLTRH